MEDPSMKILSTWRRTELLGRKVGAKLKVRPAILTYRKKWSRTTYRRARASEASIDGPPRINNPFADAA
jgi:hypothetical protein